MDILPVLHWPMIRGRKFLVTRDSKGEYRSDVRLTLATTMTDREVKSNGISYPRLLHENGTSALFLYFRLT